MGINGAREPISGSHRPNGRLGAAVGDYDRELLWSKQKEWLGYGWNYGPADYDNSELPNGPITVEEGWRFSSHELWKYMVLPYLDNTIVHQVFVNGEKARTWNSHIKGIPGLLASCYGVK